VWRDEERRLDVLLASIGQINASVIRAMPAAAGMQCNCCTSLNNAELFLSPPQSLHFALIRFQSMTKTIIS